MIETKILLDKINTIIFENHLTTDSKIFCQIETLKDLKSIILFYQKNWKVEYMPTHKNEAENCAKFYTVDFNAIKGLKKLAEDISFFLSLE